MNAKLEAMKDQIDELEARLVPPADDEVNICMEANGLSEPPTAAEEVAVRPWTPKGILHLKLIIHADAHACRRCQRQRLAA